MRKLFLKYYPFLPLFLLCCFYGYKAIDFPIHDFANYYFGGNFLIRDHFNSGIYFPYQFNKAISDLGYQNIFVSYAPNTPFLAAFFMPFSMFYAENAKLVFNGISIGLFVFSIYRLFSFYKINPKFVLLIPILFLVPIKNNLLFGQVYFLLFFLLAEGWLAYKKEHWKLMAFFWSFAILLKVFPILLLLFLVFKKQWRPVYFLAVFCCLLFAIALNFTGIDIWIFYFREVLPKASNGEIATAFVPNYQSVFMFLKELMVFDATDNPKAVFNYPVLFSAVILAFKIGILAIGYFVSKRVSKVLFAFSYWILAMILISPYGNTYTLILLVFPFLALLKSEISNVKKVGFGAILFLISNVPLSVFMEKQFPISYLRMFLLVLLFVLFLMQFRKKINWKIVAVFLLVPIISMLIFKKNEIIKSTILLIKGPILMYNYEIDENGLRGNFWNEKGEGVALMKIGHQTAEYLDLKDNQVFYKNQQLTFDKSNKLKPILIDNKTIFYLSDYDRGIGFYALRKIELK